MSDQDTMPHQPLPEDEWEEPTRLHRATDENAVEEGTIMGLSPRLLLFGGGGLLALLVLAILLFVLFLPPFNLAGSLFGGGRSLNANNPSVSHPDGITAFYVGGDAVRVRFDSIPREAFLAGQGPRDLMPALTAVPPYLTMKSPLYTINSRGDGQTLLQINIPNDSEPYDTLDLYSWDENKGEWVFVPSHVDAANGLILSEERPANIAVFQNSGATPLIGALLEPGHIFDEASASLVNLVMPTGIAVGDNGLLSGAPVGGWQLGAGYAVVPTVAAENGSGLASLLADSASRALHVADIQSFVVNDGYNGVAIDYRNIAPADRETYARFIQELGAALDAQNKLLIVFVPRPVGGANAWNTGGYDWRVIGQAADLVIVNGGAAPADYSVNGPVTSMLGWAVGEISRMKLHLGLPVSSFDETNGAPLTYEEALALFGPIALQTGLPEGQTAFPQGAALNFALPGASNITADQNTGAYVFSASGDSGERRIWLVTASTLRARLDLTARYHIGGATLTGLLGSGNDPGLPVAVNEFRAQVISSVPSQVSIAWTVSGASGALLSEKTGLGTPFAWNAADAGEYQVAAQIVGSGSYDRGQVQVAVAAPTDEPTPTATQAPRPTQSGTQQPAATQTPPPVSGTVATGAFELGGQTHTLSNPAWMRAAGMTWVKFQHKWTPGEDPAGAVGGRIQAARQNGLKILLAIPGQVNPQAIDHAAYVEFVRGVAALGPDAIEIWNEQNLSVEWPLSELLAGTGPASYVNNMLAPAYTAIKSVNPNIMVIGGAPAPSGYWGATACGNLPGGGGGCSDLGYMQQMAQAGAANYMDCMGVHYNEGIIPPSQTSGDPRGDNYYTRYFYGMLNTYYSVFGKPVCFTELGYLSPEGYGGLPPAFAWASDTSVAEQAAWLAEAAVLASQSGKVRLMVVWNVDIFSYGNDPQGGYAIIRPNGQCPACDALAAVMP